MTASIAVSDAVRDKMARNASRLRFQSIYNEIRERICLLRYPPGMALSEGALAVEFGVSRTPIRRVLNRLEFEGLVESRHGVGTIVTTVDLETLSEVYALRMKLAELIGELSPVPPSDEVIAALEDLLKRCTALRTHRDPDEFSRINMEAQHELARLIGNRALHEVTIRLYNRTARIWLQLVPEMDWEQEVDVFGDELRELIRAMRAGDVRAAGYVRRNHISMSLLRMSRFLSGVGKESAGGGDE